MAMKDFHAKEIERLVAEHESKLNEAKLANVRQRDQEREVLEAEHKARLEELQTAHAEALARAQQEAEVHIHRNT